MSDRQNILIVDDRVENLIALEDTLSVLDVNIIRATSGDEALAASLKHDFAVALLDIMMPGMDGYELAEHLRSDKKTYVIPIMFLTAFFDDDVHMFKGYEAGGVDYIVKPFVPDVLLSKVRVFLELDRHRKHLETLVADGTRKLNERVKELTCLYGVAALFQDLEQNDEDVLSAVVEQIPPAFRYPDLIGARIIIEGRKFATANFSATPWKLSADIAISKKMVGVLEVACLDEIPSSLESPFLSEERDLITAIANKTSSWLERRRSKARIDHLGIVLHSIRSVNQLIVREKDKQSLIEEACKLLVRTRGFSGAWIVLTDDSSQILNEAHTELFKDVSSEFLKLFSHGKLPRCCQKASDEARVIATSDILNQCGSCPYSGLDISKGALTTLLMHEKRYYGYISVMLPIEHIDDEEEISLFEEVAGDISFALKSIESETARRESDARYRSLFFDSRDAIMVLSPDGHFSTANPAAIQMFGCRDEQHLTTMTPESLSPKFQPDGRASSEKSKEMIRLARENGSHFFEWIHRKEDGGEFPATVLLSRLGIDGGNTLQATVRDITDIKITEQSILKLNHDLQIKNQIAEIFLSTPSLDMYGDVLKVVLTELKSPHGIFGYIDDQGAWVCPSLTRDVWDQCRIEGKRHIFPREAWGGLWGRALIEKSIQISNTPLKPPKGHIEMLRSVAMPILYDGKLIGAIAVANKATDYNESDFAFLQSLANSLSPILHARLNMAREEYRRIQAENQLKEYAADLENKVTERTQKLNDTLHVVEKSRDQIYGILKSVADGLVVTDASNRVIQMNRIAEEILGIRFDDVENKPIQFAIEDASLREKFTHTLSKLQPGYEFDFRVSGPQTNEVRIMRGRTSVVTGKDKLVKGVVTLIQDVTDEREVDRMKTEFISTAAHELRTPLTSILGFSEILLTRTNIEPKDREKYLTYINKQAIGLANIVNDLLDISRIESGKGFTLDKKECEVEDFILPLIPHFQDLTEKHKFEVDLKDKKTKLFVDSEKMGQAVRNLLSNSVKYSPKGGLIRITGRKYEASYEISVEDQGMGMKPDQVKRVFDKFYRADASSTAIEGTGLGMGIVKYIAEAHGGTVSVQSEFGKGTTVRIAIPLGSTITRLQPKEQK